MNAAKASTVPAWEGDDEFAIQELALTPAHLRILPGMVPSAERACDEAGLRPGAGVTLAATAAGPCSRCQSWTWRRLFVAFEPTDARALGAPVGKFRAFAFVFCAACMRRPGAELRAWSRDMARKQVTAMLGADGPAQ